MVRLGTLPLRLLALERGAALVYSEEIVDAKLAQATRTVHAHLGTVDWRLPCGEVLLSTCARERGRLVVQLGSACAEAALAAVAVLIDPTEPGRDGIVGIDLNMGAARSPRCTGRRTLHFVGCCVVHSGGARDAVIPPRPHPCPHMPPRPPPGCAKRNTTEHGAGFALFTDRERAERAVRALRDFLPARVAVSCKVGLCGCAATSLYTYICIYIHIHI